MTDPVTATAEQQPASPAEPPVDYLRDGAIRSVYAAMRQRYLDTGRDLAEESSLALLEHAQYTVDSALLLTGRRYVVLEAGNEQQGFDVAAAVIAGDSKANGKVPDAIDVKEGLAVIDRLIRDA
jgi:hypothetical protein